MKLLISGSREDFNVEEAHKVLEGMFMMMDAFRGEQEIIIIHGAAIGIDSMAENLAQKYKFQTIPYPVTKEEWDILGKKAGPIRNQKMVDICDRGFLIWNGNSPGTKSTMDMLIKANKPFTLHKL